MAHGPETTFFQGVNRHLPKTLHREKMHNPYRGGMPDWYYEGKHGILWVEYKFIRKVPATVDCTDTSMMLSALQQLWLRRCSRNNTPNAVIVGWEKGGVVFDMLEWSTPISQEDFLRLSMSKKEIASWLVSKTLKKQRQS